MNRLLKVGDRFLLRELPKHCVMRGALDYESGVPHVNEMKLTFDYSSSVTCRWKETKPGGWYRNRNEHIKVAVDKTNLEWTVVDTKECGGSGPYSRDPYSDGHRVIAKADSGEQLQFYQTGCFIGMVTPEMIQLI